MMRTLFTSVTGLLAEQLRTDVIANNLANANTVGYKKLRVNFQDLIYQTLRDPGVPSPSGTNIPTGLQVGLGTKPSSTQTIFSQGSYVQTDAPLDLYIQGDGFFRIQLPDGTTAYTRAGDFKIDANGQIVTSDGYYLIPNITLPNNVEEITIMDDGSVYVRTAGSNTATQIGQITIARFINPAGLRRIGKNLYVETDASGAAIVGNPGTNGLGTIMQGYLEDSNVEVVEEMVKLIIAQRSFEADSKAVQTADQMLSIANNLRR